LPAIRFRLLGRVDIAGPPGLDAEAVLARPKLVALMSYLASATPPGLHRRDTLVGLLWAEMDQEHARGALRQSLYHLRRFLGSDVVLTRGDEEVGLATDRLRSDVVAFEEALTRNAREEALDIYRGGLLEGFHLTDAAMFERWLDGRREDLQREAHRAAWSLAQDAEEAGDHPVAAHWARRALRLATHDEAVLRQVIGLLDRIGDRAGAVREYEAFARKLREDLDLEPDPETREVVEGIRSRQERPEVTASTGAPAGKPQSAPVESDRDRDPADEQPKPSPTSIAVLPFVNMGADPEEEYLGDGVAEEITTALAKVTALSVAARTSAFAFKGRNVDVRTLGGELGVATVLEGSVRRSGDRLRITAQLVKTVDGYHLWSERFDRGTEDVFAIQDEIAQSVVAALKVILTDTERHSLGRMPTSSARAYEYYLRGRHYLRQTRRRSLEYARAMFTQAIAVDPDFALAHAGIADCSSLLHVYYPSAESAVEQAEEASRRAVELGPDLPETHASRGFALSQQRRFDQAAREFEAAIRLDPGQFDARYWFGRQCFQRGLHQEAARWFESAASVREDYQARFFAAQSYEALGDSESAHAAYHRALEVVRRHIELYPDDPRAATMRAVASCRIGDRPEGMRWAERALEIDPEDAGVRYNVACLYALEGERDRALKTLEECVGLGFTNLEWIAQDPDLACLKDDDRFRRLVAEVRQPRPSRR